MVTRVHRRGDSGPILPPSMGTDIPALREPCCVSKPQAKRAGLAGHFWNSRDDLPRRVCCFGDRLDNGPGNNTYLVQHRAFDVTYLIRLDSQQHPRSRREKRVHEHETYGLPRFPYSKCTTHHESWSILDPNIARQHKQSHGSISEVLR